MKATMTVRPLGDVARVHRVLLSILLTTAVSATAVAERTRIDLSDGWYVKQLLGSKHDVVELTDEAASPVDSWLATRMPARVSAM